MYKIITHTGETHLTEKPNFIRKHQNGCFVMTDEETAEGVAYNGTPYIFAEGNAVHEFDAADLVKETEEENKNLKAQIAALSDQNDFQEELIVELANIVYA